MDIYFRVANKNDVELLLRLMSEFYAISEYPFDAEVVRPALAKFISNAALGRLWLIEHEDQAIGYVALTISYSLEFHGRDAFVDELFVEAKHRGQGVGGQALHFVEEKCREFGVNALHLEVERTNLAAQALYKKSGFQNHDRFLMTKWIS